MAEGPPGATGLFIAVTSFHSYHEGLNRPVPIARGTIADGRHPIVAATPQMWAPLHVDYDVTTADATDKEQ